ncbi:MAG: DUF5985 family protein [Acidobacteriota bacterium]
MGYAAGLFFLRFWRDSGDRLFAYFATLFSSYPCNESPWP